MTVSPTGSLLYCVQHRNGKPEIEHAQDDNEIGSSTEQATTKPTKTNAWFRGSKCIGGQDRTIHFDAYISGR